MTRFKKGQFYKHRNFKDIFVRLIDIKEKQLKYHVTFEYWLTSPSGDSIPLWDNKNRCRIVQNHVLRYEIMSGFREFPDPFRSEIK